MARAETGRSRIEMIAAVEANSMRLDERENVAGAEKDLKWGMRQQ